MSKTIHLTTRDLEFLGKIVEENNITGAFRILQDSSSGIGYTTDMEFDTNLHGRLVTIRVSISGSENW